MSAPQFDQAKVKKAMWLAPAFAVVGLLPFIIQLDLTVLQLLALLLAVVLVSYLLGLCFGAPGYFILKRLGKPHAKYLIGYAVVLVALVAIVVQDPYALLVFGPPTLIVAAAFCYLRGAELQQESSVS